MLTRLMLHKLGLCNRNPDFRLRLRLHHVIVFGFDFSCNHSKLIRPRFRLHSPFMCFIWFCHCATLWFNVAQQFLCDVLLSRFLVRWCFVAKLFYLIIAGWLYQAVLLIQNMATSLTVHGFRYLAREEVLIECTNSWIYWVLRRCPWNEQRTSLREK